MRYPIVAVLFLVALNVGMCDHAPSKGDGENRQFVVTATVPDSLNKDCWFFVIDIKNSDTTGVYAVKEFEGTYYLPIMSRVPLFNNKIVEGIFIEDSIAGMTAKDALFVITRVVRDTSGGFPHLIGFEDKEKDPDKYTALFQSIGMSEEPFEEVPKAVEAQ